MTDFANLGMRIDSTQVKQGVAELDKLTAAGVRAEASTVKFGASSKAAAVGAAAMAAQAQASSRAAVGAAAGFGAVTNAVHGNTIAMRESLVVGRELLSGNLTRLPGSLSILAQQFAISGKGASGFASQILQSFGIIKKVTDAELAGEAATAAIAASAVESVAARAQANVLAADTEVALAQAAIKTAATSEALTAAQAQLAAAHEAVAAAAGEATTAEVALADANAAAAETAKAASASSAIRLTGLGTVLVGVGAAATVAFGAFKAFQHEIDDSGVLDRYAQSLGLTAKQIDHLKDVTVTFGDVWKGLGRTISQDLIGEDIGRAITDPLADAAIASVNIMLDAFAEIYAGSYAVFKAIGETWSNLPGVLDAITTEAANGVLKIFTDMVNDVIKEWNRAADKLADAFGAKHDAPIPLVPLDVATNLSKQGDEAQKIIEKSYGEGFAQATAAERKFIADWKKNNVQAAKDRIKDEAPNGPKPKKVSDHGLAQALAELDAQIEGQNRLAAAYQVSDQAAIKAEALQKAEEQAIRHKGEVGLFYEKELALAIATRTADGAKVVADLRYEADARAAVNGQVASGLIPASQAGQALELETKLRPLTAAAAIAEGKAKTALVDVIRNLTKANADNNAEIERAQVLSATDAANNQIAQLKLEATLIGQTNEVRAVAIAQLQAQQFLEAHPGASADEAQKYIDSQKTIAQLTADLSTAQNNYNNSLSATADILGVINDQAQAAGQGLADAFGSVGQGVSSALTALSGYAAEQAKLDQDHKAAVLAAGGDAKALATVEILYAKKSSLARTQATFQVLSGLKSLFKEHSVGYQVMTAIEKAYAIFQAVQSAIAIARDIAHTASTLTNSAVRTTANTAEGGSKIFAQLGVWAFPVVAAMVAVLAALGASAGGGGGGGATPPTSADDLQAAAGTGTVLGSPKDKSASIAHSLELVAANTNTDLQYSNSMLKALRSIDFSISKLAGTVAKQISVSGSLFDTSKLALGTSGSSGFLGLFSSSTTRSLYDAGINLASATIGNIVAAGISGNTYQIVEQIKKSSGFLGIGGGTHTTYTTTNGAIDPSITAAIQAVIISLRDGLVTAAGVIGLDGAKAILDSFNVSIGKISFKDMTGQEIEDQLNAIFSKVGDQMAAALLPSLAQMQKVGEGLFETFIRVAKEYETVDIELKSIGKTFGAVGVGSVEARDALVQLFGSLDDFVTQTDFFREKFFTEAQQIAPVQASVIAELQRLGMAGITTRDQFREAVLGLDLTTDAGRQMYASLLALAPAFDKVVSYFDALNKAAEETLQSTIDKFTAFADSLKKYRDTLFQTDAAQGNAYQALKAKFAATSALAATGDATALGGLESAGKDFLTSARNNASSMQQYLRDVALVARGVDQGITASLDVVDYAQLQLDALKNATTILGTIATNTAATATALVAPVSATVPTPTAAAQIAPSTGGNDAMQVELQGLRSDLNAALQAIASNTGSTDRTLKRWDDGEAMKITTPDDSPLDVNLESWG